MERTPKRNRPSKREVITIDDDDSVSETPSKRIVKKRKENDFIVIDDEESNSIQPVVNSGAQPVPSPRVVELQQEVLKLEDKLQRLCRFTREAQLRAEFLENLVDSKRGVKDDMEKEKKKVEVLELKLAELTCQLEDARRKVEESSDVNSELKLENATLKTEMDAERHKASEDRKKYRARIKDLKKTLAQYEEETHHEQSDQVVEQIPQVDTASQSNVSPPEMAVDRHVTDPPIDIFQLCRPDSIESMPYENARDIFLSVLAKIKGGSVREKMTELFRKIPYLKYLILHCEACEKTLNHCLVMEHFLSKRHGKEVSALGAVVSRASFKYWLDKLKTTASSREVSAVKRPLVLHGIGHPIDIFQLCHPDSSNSVSPEAARDKLLSVIDAKEGKDMQSRLLQCFSPGQSMSMILDCDVCSITLIDVTCIITHFVSKGHHTKVHSLGAAVSSAALQYWMDKLNSEIITKDTTNIFQLCPLDSRESISYQRARAKFLSILGEIEGDSIHHKANVRFSRHPELKKLKFVCDTCGKTPDQASLMIEHFLSKGHYIEVRRRGAAISRAAFDYWMDKLKPEKRKILRAKRRGAKAAALAGGKSH